MSRILVLYGTTVATPRRWPERSGRRSERMAPKSTSSRPASLDRRSKLRGSFQSGCAEGLTAAALS
jgi:hypothetical protein